VTGGAAQQGILIVTGWQNSAAVGVPTPTSPLTPDAAPEFARQSVDKLTLTDFRCYARLRLETGPAPVVLTGPNGAGKTNILEALSFLAPGRGLRRARLAEASRREPGEISERAPERAQERPSLRSSERAWAVAVRIRTPDGPRDVGTGREVLGDEKREKRRVQIDGQPVSAQAALAEICSVQWLTPAMDRLFQEGPKARRSFLDRMVIGQDPAHAGRLYAYEHALRERSKLLRSGSQKPDPAWLDALEETLAAKGVAVAAARAHLARDLNEFCAHPLGPFPGAGLRLAGEVEDWLGEAPALEAEDRLRGALKNSREHDAEAGGAASGPHRSDLTVRHLARGRPAAECSTGEQKALLIAIQLGAARMQRQASGAAPLLLLDEVTAHLDETRRAALFDELEALDAQAWMTGTDAALFDGLKGRAQFFAVRDGVVTAEF